MTASRRIEWIDTLQSVPADSWNALFATDYPFTRYDFLQALESGGSVGPGTGWQASHLTIWQGEQLVAAVPAYLKQHSYGEYLFDWAIVEAYQRYGLDFFPKLVLAIPFTPAEGPRFGVLTGEDQAELMALMLDALQQRMKKQRLSSIQCLYPNEAQREHLTAAGYWPRQDVQFEWRNYGYAFFDDFLASLSSRKRKQIRKERQRVQDAGVALSVVHGCDADAMLWQQLYRFYQRTYLKRSGHAGYLTEATFHQWGQQLADSIVIFAAYQQQQLIAASLCFRSADTLYGRYWGCEAEWDFLHFEACYYAGIAYCIEQGLQRFDAGAQGEHKLQRGFEPVTRYGCYHFRDSPLKDAIGRYFEGEEDMLALYQRQAQARLPFRQLANSEPLS